MRHHRSPRSRWRIRRVCDYQSKPTRRSGKSFKRYLFSNSLRVLTSMTKPEGVSKEEAAIASDAGVTAYNAVKATAGVRDKFA